MLAQQTPTAMILPMFRKKRRRKDNILYLPMRFEGASVRMPITETVATNCNTTNTVRYLGEVARYSFVYH